MSSKRWRSATITALAQAPSSRQLKRNRSSQILDILLSSWPFAGVRSTISTAQEESLGKSVIDYAVELHADMNRSTSRFVFKYPPLSWGESPGDGAARWWNLRSITQWIPVERNRGTVRAFRWLFPAIYRKEKVGKGEILVVKPVALVFDDSSPVPRSSTPSSPGSDRSSSPEPSHLPRPSLVKSLPPYGAPEQSIKHHEKVRSEPDSARAESGGSRHSRDRNSTSPRHKTARKPHSARRSSQTDHSSSISCQSRHSRRQSSTHGNREATYQSGSSSSRHDVPQKTDQAAEPAMLAHDSRMLTTEHWLQTGSENSGPDRSIPQARDSGREWDYPASPLHDRSEAERLKQTKLVSLPLLGTGLRFTYSEAVYQAEDGMEYVRQPRSKTF